MRPARKPTAVVAGLCRFRQRREVAGATREFIHAGADQIAVVFRDQELLGCRECFGGRFARRSKFTYT